MSKTQRKKARRAASARQQIQDQNFIAGYVACGGNNRGKAQIRGDGKRGCNHARKAKFHVGTWVLTTTPKL